MIWAVVKLVAWALAAYLVIGLTIGSAVALRENWRRVLVVLAIFPGLPILVGVAAWVFERY